MRAVYLTDILRDVVAAASAALLPQLQQGDPLITGIRFDYGHYLDIQQRILEISKSQSESATNFPLVAVFEDFRILHEQEGLWGISDLKMIVLHSTKAEYTRQQREDLVFRPVLYPIYLEILNQLKRCGKFQIYDDTKIQHDQINRPHWGDPALYRNEGYLLGAVLDGIELSNLRLSTYLKIC